MCWSSIMEFCKSWSVSTKSTCNIPELLTTCGDIPKAPHRRDFSYMMMVVGGLESSKNIACTILRKIWTPHFNSFLFSHKGNPKPQQMISSSSLQQFPVACLVLRRGWQERGKGFLRESEENSLTPRNNNTNAVGDQCKEVHWASSRQKSSS